MTWPVEQSAGGRDLSVTEDAARRLCSLAGRRLLGVVAAGDYELELVFEDVKGDEGGRNLVTIYAGTAHGDLLDGRLDFGGVLDPERYAA